MNYVIDTHIFLWLIFEPDRISKRLLTLLKEPSNRVYVTSITFWEISLKYGLGKLDLQGVTPDELPSIARQMDLEVTDIDAQTMATFHRLPKEGTHKDPFDRIIIWSCITNGHTIVSEDGKFRDHEQFGLARA